MCEWVSQAFGGVINRGLRPSPETLYSPFAAFISIQTSISDGIDSPSG
jgi:hypothetical protein